MPAALTAYDRTVTPDGACSYAHGGKTPLMTAPRSQLINRRRIYGYDAFSEAFALA